MAEQPVSRKREPTSTDDSDKKQFQILPAGPPPNMSKRRLIFDSLKKIIGRTFRAGTTAKAVIGSNSKADGGSGTTASAGGKRPASKAANAAGANAAAGEDDDSKAYAGKKTGLGLHPDSVAYKCWGAGYQGQLGRKFERYAKKYAMTPEIVKVNLACRQVAAGALHSALVTDDGRVWTWGDGRQEQLGYTPKAYTNQTEPTEIEGPNAGPLRLASTIIVKVACGAGHTLCLDDQGRIYVFGTNRYGQLGTLDKQVKKQPFHLREAKIFGNQAVPRFEDIGCGENHSVALTSTNEVFAWGANKHGQLGLGDTADKVHPTPLLNFKKKTTALACGSIHTVYLTSEGELYVCGFGEHFYPKNPHTTNGDAKDQQNFYYEPTLIPFPNGDRIKQAACGQNHILALNLNGDVYAWGSGDYGQLGHGVRPRSHGAHVYLDAPRMVLEGKTIKQVACGRYHSVALNAWGILFSWGCGENGQLGHDGDENTYVPRVVEANIGTVVGQVACGEHHTIALTSTRWEKVNHDVTEWLRAEREEYELKVEKTSRATHTHGLLAKDLGKITDLMNTKKANWNQTKRDAAVREEQENAAHIQSIDKKSSILDKLKREVVSPTKQWMLTGVPDHMIAGAGGAGQSGAAPQYGPDGTPLPNQYSGGDTKRDTPSPPIEGDFEDRRTTARSRAAAAAAASQDSFGSHPHAQALGQQQSGSNTMLVPSGPLAFRPRPPNQPRPSGSVQPSGSSGGLASTAPLPRLASQGKGSAAPDQFPRLATPQQQDTSVAGYSGPIPANLMDVSPRSAQSRAVFLKESSVMVSRLKKEIAAKITATSDNQLKSKLNWVHGFRKEYDALRSATIQKEKEVAVLIRQAQFLRTGNDLYSETKDNTEDRRTVLEMKLNTVHINIQEAKVNEANYKNTIKYLKEEELERHKRIDALRRQVQDTDQWTRKVNEQKILWNDHRIRAEQELASFSYEVGGFKGFMDEQLQKMHTVTSTTNARKAEREEVKTKKQKNEKAKIHQRIERLTLEMDAKTLEAGEMGNALESVYERLRFFEKRFQQIAAATGLTDPDDIINKFLLKEEMRAELSAARDAKLAIIAAKEKERTDLVSEMEVAREQYRDSKWKDVDHWEERYRTDDAHATRQQVDTERLNQRLAFFQEGLITLLTALPALPSDVDPQTGRVNSELPPHHSWPPAPEKTGEILALLESRLAALASTVNIGPMSGTSAAAAAAAAGEYHESDDESDPNTQSAGSSVDADRKRASDKKAKSTVNQFAAAAQQIKSQRFAEAVTAPLTPGGGGGGFPSAGNATPPAASGGASARVASNSVSASYGAAPSTAPSAN